MSALIVGLSGVTSGGKSTLAKYLKEVLPAGTKLIKQDDYFLPEHSPLHMPSPGGINHHNWDVISSVDMDKMVQNIKSIYSDLISDSATATARTLHSFLGREVDFLKTVDPHSVSNIISLLQVGERLRGIILIDGFTIYDDPRLSKMAQLKFFLTLPKEECFARRQTRVYDPPDPPGYFDACVWPMYEAHVKRVRKLSNINFYDGTANIEDIFISVLRKIVDVAATL